MRQRRKTHHPRVRVREVAGEPCYAIADAARVLGRSRPTLMRWAPHFRRYTGHSALRDGSSRWFFPIAAVERLQHDPTLRKELARSACVPPDGQLSRCVRDVSFLKKEVSRLRADVSSLKKQARKTG
jgi:hypothetical protein